MTRFKPALWLSFGLVCLTLALTLTAYVLGLVPDGYKTELDSRAKVAESLAVQLAGAVNRNDNDLLSETLSAIVERNDDVHSAALRHHNGGILVSAGDHETNWVVAEDGQSTPTHVVVPLTGSGGNQGAIELSFGPASTMKRYAGIPSSLLLFLLYMTAFGFLGYFMVLRRTLKELDPGRVIPERVQKAFDTLAEGVLIVDEKERIVLVNTAFADFYGNGGPDIGTKINALPWRMVDGTAAAGGYPWHIALREDCEMREDSLSLRTTRGEIFNFDVNATTISNDGGKLIGAIVTLRDLTNLKRSKEELAKTQSQLQYSQDQLEAQNKQLAYLTHHDGLTGCLYRKPFVDRLATDINIAHQHNGMVGVLTVRIDGLSELNAITGPSIGDDLLVSVADHLKSVMGDTAYISRQGSDQFCIALPGSNADAVAQFATSAHKFLLDGINWFRHQDSPVRLTIGWATTEQEKLSARELLVRAGKTAMTSDPVVDETPENRMANAPDAQEIGRPQANQTPQFDVRLDFARRNADRNKKQVAIVQFAVIGWRYLREALGEEDFTDLIQSVRQRLSSSLQSNNEIIVLKDSGEFLTFFDHFEDDNEVNFLVARILSSLHAPFNYRDRELYVSCKTGVALYPEHGVNNQDLKHNVAVAVTRALEESNIEGIKYFHPSMIEQSRTRFDIENGIREALRNNEFRLTFQPIVDCESGALSAVETLLRCTNRSLEGVPISEIIDVAEQSSLTAEIDMWVMKNALAKMQEWCDAKVPIPKISINISAKQLTNISYMESVFEVIKAVRFSPSRVQVEVTETAKMADVGIAAPQLKRLQHLGVIIALDDFGTGQASLTYLQRLHPDVIKLDRSFVTGVNSNHANATLVGAMTVMAHCLGLKVVVEGVETREQLQFLRETRCDEVQGYLISKPLPEDIITDWITVYTDGKGARDYVEDILPARHQSLPPHVGQNAA